MPGEHGVGLRLGRLPQRHQLGRGRDALLPGAGGEQQSGRRLERRRQRRGARLLQEPGGLAVGAELEEAQARVVRGQRLLDAAAGDRLRPQGDHGPLPADPLPGRGDERVVEAQHLLGVGAALGVGQVEVEAGEELLGCRGTAAPELDRGREQPLARRRRAHRRGVGDPALEQPPEPRLDSRLRERRGRRPGASRTLERDRVPQPGGGLPFRRQPRLRRGRREAARGAGGVAGLELVEGSEQREQRDAPVRALLRQLLKVDEPDLDTDLPQRAVELGLPHVRAADQERGGRLLLLRERAPLRAQVLPGLLPVVPAEQVLRLLEAGLDRGERGRGEAERDE